MYYILYIINNMKMRNGKVGRIEN